MSDDKKPPKAKESENFRGIIRIMGKDLNGQLALRQALPKLRGIGRNLSRPLIKAIESTLKISPTIHVGDLTDEQIQSIEKLLKTPDSVAIRPFLLNRSKSAGSQHLTQSDLDFAVRQDKEQEKQLRSWRGWRSSLGQKVRGQHTRTTGRTGLTVGVLKKALKQQKTAPAADKEKK